MDTHTLIKVRFTGRKALALFALVFTAAFPLFSYGAIAFDGAGSTSATNAASVTWSHAIGSGSNTVLVVGLSTEDTSTSVMAVNSITYNGVALTAVPNATATDGMSTFDRAQLFYLLNPPTGSHAISVTFGGAVNGVSAGSVSLSGAAQIAPAAAATGILDSGSALSTSVAVSTAGSWLVDAVCSGASSATFTASDSAMIKRWGTSQSNSGGAGATKVVNTAGTSSMSWTASSGGRMAGSVAVIAPA